MESLIRRGDVWTVAGGANHAGKPRPVVIVQDDSFDGTDSITICAFTTVRLEAPLFRLAITPTAANGLKAPSQLMVDKITTIPRSKLGRVVGRLHDDDVVRLNRAITVFLGLGASPNTARR